MHGNFCEKNSKLDFSCPIKNWWLDIKINPKDLLFPRLCIFSKKISSYTLIGVFFLLLVLFFSKYAEIAFILYLTTNFYLGMKNPILGFFS